jgi:hypothetical protein
MADKLTNSPLFKKTKTNYDKLGILLQNLRKWHVMLGVVTLELELVLREIIFLL